MDDPAMNCPQPTLSPADAVAAGRVLFEVACTTALSLGSERDQAFMLLDGSRKVAVVPGRPNATRNSKGTWVS